MKLPPRLVLASLCLPLLVLACQSAARDRSSGDLAAADAKDTLGDVSTGKEDAKDPKKDKGDEKEDKQDQLRKKEHELEYARRDLRIARLESEGEEREAKNALNETEFKLKEALTERDHYKDKESALKLVEEQLSMDRAQEHRERQRQELEELEAMYKQEDLATLTKELVIRRSKMDLVLADKALDLENKKFAELREHEIPKKERELDQALTKAEKEFAEAKAKLDRHAVQKELKLLKAEHAIDELERDVAKLKAEIAKQKAGEKPKPEQPDSKAEAKG